MSLFDWTFGIALLRDVQGVQAKRDCCMVCAPNRNKCGPYSTSSMASRLGMPRVTIAEDLPRPRISVEPP